MAPGVPFCGKGSCGKLSEGRFGGKIQKSASKFEFSLNNLNFGAQNFNFQAETQIFGGKFQIYSKTSNFDQKIESLA